MKAEKKGIGTVLRLTQDNKTRVKWFEDDSVSLEEVAVLNLETEVPKKTKLSHTKNQNC